MTKKEEVSYKRKIDQITDGLLIDAYKVALNEVDKLHRDILLGLRAKIDAWLLDHPEKND